MRLFEREHLLVEFLELFRPMLAKGGRSGQHCGGENAQACSVQSIEPVLSSYPSENANKPVLDTRQGVLQKEVALPIRQFDCVSISASERFLRRPFLALRSVF